MSLNSRLKKIILDLEELENDCDDSRDAGLLWRIIERLKDMKLVEPLI